ncbi:hypothetical protein FIBSPDRAFT_21699 [Athelia psychrophila]|uniref:Uncharacterized protein n=1 Tax=Athelia psychrophila TaxID=1759441 RepID=A0A166GDC6_9AGAM|nr:hypothetical protein FIBSPDRAFT_21699 [Fibularhizoctonia sp. CBS 109695]
MTRSPPRIMRRGEHHIRHCAPKGSQTLPKRQPKLLNAHCHHPARLGRSDAMRLRANILIRTIGFEKGSLPTYHNAWLHTRPPWLTSQNDTPVFTPHPDGLSQAIIAH